MSDNDDDLKEKAGIGCAFVYIGIQLAIPIMVFLLLAMLLMRGCVRMFS